MHSVAGAAAMAARRAAIIILRVRIRTICIDRFQTKRLTKLQEAAESCADRQRVPDAFAWGGAHVGTKDERAVCDFGHEGDFRNEV
jgi:hypothetical protein